MTDLTVLGDKFDKAKIAIEGLPGYHAKRSSFDTNKFSLLPGATWIVETARTDETSMIFIQSVSAEGSQRIVLPNKVAETIYRHYKAIMEVRRSDRGKRAAETRKSKLLKEAQIITAQ